LELSASHLIGEIKERNTNMTEKINKTTACDLNPSQRIIVIIGVFQMYTTLKERRKHPGADNVCLALAGSLCHQTIQLSPAAILSGDVLEICNVIVFPGGTATKQSSALGRKGRRAIRMFVSNGGGYVGICAGGFLAASHYNPEQSLRLLRASCVMQFKSKSIANNTTSTHSKGTPPQPWMRGQGHVDVRFTESGRIVLWEEEGKTWKKEKEEKKEGIISLRYCNGPLFQQVEDNDTLKKSACSSSSSSSSSTSSSSSSSSCGIDVEEEDPATPASFQVLATFASDLEKNGMTSMIGVPAIVLGHYGAGTVVCISPHPESTSTAPSLAKRSGKERFQKLIQRCVRLTITTTKQLDR